MRGFKGSVLLVALVSLLAFSNPQPANAAMIVHDPTSLAKMIADAASNVMKLLSGFSNIFGNIGTTLPTPIGAIDGKPVVTTPCPYTTLIGYMKCAEKERNQVNAFTTTVNHQFQAGLRADQKKEADVKLQLEAGQVVKRDNVQAYADAIGRDVVFCETPSMNQSTLAQIMMARLMLEEAMAVAAMELDGDVSNPTWSRGDLQRAQDTLNKVNSEGLMAKGSNGGAAEELCKSGGAGCTTTAYTNADIKGTTLTGAWLLDEADKKPFSRKYAEMYVNDMLFPDRAFVPIDKSHLDRLSPRAATAFMEKRAYAAQYGTFMKTFLDEIAERKGTQGMASTPFLEAALERAGITGEIKDRLIKDSKTSLKGSRFIRYKVYMHDPKTTLEAAGPSAMNPGNIASLALQREMDQVALLYDVTDALEETNRLLALIGSVILSGKKPGIDSRVSSISGP